MIKGRCLYAFALTLPLLVSCTGGNHGTAAAVTDIPVNRTLASESETPNCEALAPSTEAAQNSLHISGCLSLRASVKLTAGVFVIERVIIMPAGSKMVGLGDFSSRAVLAAAPNFTGTNIIALRGGSLVRNLRATGAGHLEESCCTAIFSIEGSDNHLELAEAFNLDAISGQNPTHSRSAHTTGIYFIGDGDSQRNVVTTSLVHDVFNGVIFRAGLPKTNPNVLEQSEILRTACDGVNLVGYGVVQNNLIHEVGSDCLQEPTPIGGAGIYSLDNQDGARISGNQIAGFCGHGLDLVHANGFEVLANTVHLEGRPFGGTIPYCVGGVPASFVDSSHMNVSGNSFVANNAAPLGLFLNLFPDFAAETFQSFAPLPQRDKQIFGMRLLRIHEPVIGNTFANNLMVAYCNTGADCVGSGFYVGPGTGTDPSGVGNGQTTNYFTGNHVIGSNIGSLRCGNDWYAANSNCTADHADPACNDDDFQHPPGLQANWARNDFCAGDE